jgi:cell wall-associated NlpC family hydrolase
MAEALPARLYSDLIGQPYQPAGRGPAYDCYGLVRCVLLRMGLDVPDYPSSGDTGLNVSLIMAAMEGGWEKLDGPEPGAVVLFKVELRVPTHVGIVVDREKFLHIMKDTNAVRERLKSPAWKRRVTGFYRWKP